MTEKYKAQIVEHLDVLKNGKFAIDRKHNIGPFLSEIYTWQTTCAVAEERLKEAWKAAQASCVPVDDELRKLGKGDHIVAESPSLSCLAKLSSPSERFDLEKFVDAVAKKFKIKKSALLALAEVSRTEGKASLSKRVLEV